MPGRFDSRILHMGLLSKPLDDFERTILEFQPDYLVMTTLTPEISFMGSLVRVAKRALPHSRVLLGGPYASAMPSHAARQWGIDAVGIGEGDETIVELLDAFEGNGEIEKVKGIAFAENGRIIKTETRSPIWDINTLPMPAWDLIDLEPYATAPNMSNSLKGRNYASLFTSRGCPYNCIYCHSIYNKRFRGRSADLVLAEMTYLHEKYGIDEFHIMDDIFNFNRKRMYRICQGIIDSGMKLYISFPNGIRTDLLKTEDIDILEKAGVYKLKFAIETRSERLQKAIRKNNKFKRIDPIIRYTSRSGIIASSFFMIGFPTETREEMMRTIDYAVNSDLDAASFFQVIPYPGTELWEWAFRENGHLADSFSFKPEHFHFSSGHSATTDLCSRDLTYLVHTAYLRFYTKPGRLWRLFRKMPNRWLFLRSFFTMVKRFGKCCLRIPMSENWNIIMEG